MYYASDLFDLKETGHAAIFEQCEYAWEVLKHLEEYVRAHLTPGCHNRLEGQAYIGKEVYIGEGTVVEDGVMIKGPAIIGRNCEIRHNAYIRENVIIGDDCVIGNASEVKNALLFNGCQVAHFNYVGDSILGHLAHLGAGAKISNIKMVPGNVMLEKDGLPWDTGLRKFGAIIGDMAEIGCNAVLNPGSIIGRNSLIYPNVSWRGILPANFIVKNKAGFDVVVKRPRTTT
jgi:UDP-N-acetylglucosamine diphosphorylase / glucose-1-phosphate thymidylyltransferase / UDP-N-acetylgalactosamine diphosphorylase / glucosamine-1-phosphate N-acetyltransferase / galactosamine-1-phosphate N-acetyltransferase